MLKRQRNGHVPGREARTLAAICFACAIPATVYGQEVRNGAEPEGTAQRRHSLFGEKLDVGLVTGVTLTSDHETGYIGTQHIETHFFDPVSKSLLPTGPIVRFRMADFNRPLVGAFAEIGVAEHLSLQATVLFRSLASKWDQVYTKHDINVVVETKTQDIWEIPVLVKYRFGNPQVRPFIGAGPAFRFRKNRPRPGTLRSPFHGAVAAVGLDLRWGRRWVITPQANYTRWAKRKTPEIPPSIRNANQVQFLIGFSF